MQQFLTRLLPSLAVLAAAGCGKDGGPVTPYPVGGQVIYDGKPAAGVQVFYFPENAPTPPDIPANPHAVTGPDGRFTLSTFEDGDGAPEGSYRVILYWPLEKSDGVEVTDADDRLFGWYDSKHTKLKAKVRAGSNSPAVFKLQAMTGPPPASEGIPGRN